MKTLFRKLPVVLLLSVGLCVGVQAQRVPGAIKYQAVLRDVNGKTLANKDNVNLRVSLRMDDPVSGQIAYSEDHKGIATNAYGVIHLEIGRGAVISGKSLHDVSWAGHEIYVQIEIETDGTGYTHMGNAELLTVPYAFYAENASGDNLYENLSDNVIPKFNEANKTLVNSGLSQTGRDLEVDASSVTFIDKATGKSGYKFPMSAGSRGQVLLLGRDGQLEWGNASGGGGSSINLDGDGHLVYWNENNGLDTISALKYNYRNAGRNIELNTNITGRNNVLVSDKLGDGQFWVGDNHSTSLTPVRMHGDVSMDKEGFTTLNLSGHVEMNGDGKTFLNLTLDGLSLDPDPAGGPDILKVTATGGSTGGSLWVKKDKPGEGYTQMYPDGVITDIYVGIGQNNPTALLHLNGENVLNNTALLTKCNLEGVGTYDIKNNLPYLKWDESNASLFVGALPDNVLRPTIGRFSVALGLNASAVPENSFAFGKESSVSAGATDAFAIGNNSTASASNSIALGRAATASGENSVALGYNAKATGDNSVVLGNQSAGESVVAIGYDNTVNTKAIVIGNTNALTSEGSIVIGSGNTTQGNSICIGHNDKGTQVPANSIVVGSRTTTGLYDGITVLGQATGSGNYSTSVGQGNDIQGDFVNLLGFSLSNDGNYESLTMIGDQFTSSAASFSSNPVLMVGSSALLFEVSKDGDIYSSGSCNASDERLKKNIKPMDWSPALLDRITPVSYVFKSDTIKKRTRFGFIAQDVQKTFPELVTEGNKGLLSMDYIGLIPVLWQINRELSHTIDALQQRVEEQDRRQAELERELQAIKEKVERLGL